MRLPDVNSWTIQSLLYNSIRSNYATYNYHTLILNDEIVKYTLAMCDCTCVLFKHVLILCIVNWCHEICVFSSSEKKLILWKIMRKIICKWISCNVMRPLVVELLCNILYMFWVQFLVEVKIMNILVFYHEVNIELWTLYPPLKD